MASLYRIEKITLEWPPFCMIWSKFEEDDAI